MPELRYPRWLTQAGGPHDVERTLAMQLGVFNHLAFVRQPESYRHVAIDSIARLVLMTVHDVMKLDILRPIVGVGELHPQTCNPRRAASSMASSGCSGKNRTDVLWK